MDTRTAELGRKALEGDALSREDGLYLAEEAPLRDLIFWAGEVRARHSGDEIALCAIANARSGACTEDCAFCAQSAHHGTGVSEYALLPSAELSRAARDAEAAGADAFCIVTSGRGPADGFASLIERARDVKDAIGVELHVSVGAVDKEQVRGLMGAGVTSANHNLETSERFYPSICSTHDWRERVRNVEVLRDEGLDPCSGGVFGMGETWADRVDLALALRGLGVRRVPVNFLNPVAGTPLAGRALLAAREALRVIAVLRLMLPDATIRTCGGRERVLGPLQPLMFDAGASATMLGDYLTTEGRPGDEDLALIKALGLRTRAEAMRG
ncbi:MAG: biotin synthase BioB [Planctomycetota bacterium]|jgi:biotin synthase